MKRSSGAVAPDPTFSDAVIGWQRQHGRHALPWQNTRDAYRIWLSEIMLQQTQVAAVLEYYARFLARFPDVASLAAASQDEVMALWSGLGYYTRARNLHRAAQQVMREHDGIFPVDPQQLVQLPGIGRSTAAAIGAFAAGARAAILDGNVKRVFARVFGIDAYPGAKAVEDALWLRAEALLPDTGIEAYTQGLMDLGATLCTRSSPDCQRCPLKARCVALASDRVAELPLRKPKKTVPEKQVAMLVLLAHDQVLLAQRASEGIWGGLHSLPELGGHLAREHTLPGPDAAAAAGAAFGTVEQVDTLLPLVHVFTHYRLHIHPYRVTLSQAGPAVAGHSWCKLADTGQAPLPAPVKKLLADLAQPSLFGA